MQKFQVLQFAGKAKTTKHAKNARRKDSIERIHCDDSKGCEESKKCKEGTE